MEALDMELVLEKKFREMKKCSKKQSWKVGSGAQRKELVKNEEV